MEKQTILEQQAAYYRARAAEYDEWFYRVGRYDKGGSLNQLWFDEAAQLRSALHSLPLLDTALELACGTGIWTQELLKVATHITALDASPEMLTLNQAKLNASDRVNYAQADLFQWQPDGEYDLVFFSFWLSHVPPDLLDQFLAKVYQAVKPGGYLFLIDSRRESTSTAHDHTLPNEGDIYQERKLNDGSNFMIVKIFYTVVPLQQALERTGFEVTVTETPTYFIYVSGIRPAH
ncbi:MAG TPA: class I SAM-dependent methyltransferase [Phototrophicaceae bacterium]|jgi:demethylmenaquinone methyltransferase/2-methoxy-6-polyprenyl-1,4-benzoquinol methylase|nr:class I SAM-dependent methyltransferase [Phototrophicaceae bacterium]